MTLDPVSAVRLSLVVGLLSTVVMLAPAMACAWLLARGNFRGRSLLSGVVMLPLVMPPVVTGLLLLRVLGRSTPLGSALAAVGWPVPFTLTGAVVAACVVGFPLYVMAIRGAFEAVDPRLEEVSWTLGAPPRWTFLRVTLPLALPGVLAGMVLAFARGLGEFGATAILAGNMEGTTRTIALAVYALLDAPDGEAQVRTLLGASVGLSVVSLVLYEVLNRRQRRSLEWDRD